jgi:RecA-family ATPase
LLASRKANKKAEHLMFLAGPFKKPVTYWHLNERYSKAREAAAKKAREAGREDLALAVEAMFLRDCRRLAANKAKSMEEARQLLQHDKAATTRIYRSEVEKITPVR